MIEFEKYIDKEITISGFAEKVRNIKWVQFIVLRNGTQRVQITIEKSEEKNAEMVKKVEGLTNESTIKVTGKLVKNENVKMGGMEIIPTSLEITSLAAPELPISITNKDAAQIDSIIEKIDAAMKELDAAIKRNIPEGIETEWSEQVRSNWNEYYGADVPEAMAEMKLSATNLRLAVDQALKYSKEQ